MGAMKLVVDSYSPEEIDVVGLHLYVSGGGAEVADGRMRSSQMLLGGGSGGVLISPRFWNNSRSR